MWLVNVTINAIRAKNKWPNSTSIPYHINNNFATNADEIYVYNYCSIFIVTEEDSKWINTKRNIFFHYRSNQQSHLKWNKKLAGQPTGRIRSTPWVLLTETKNRRIMKIECEKNIHRGKSFLYCWRPHDRDKE